MKRLSIFGPALASLAALTVPGMPNLATSISAAAGGLIQHMPKKGRRSPSNVAALLQRIADPRRTDWSRTPHASLPPNHPAMIKRRLKAIKRIDDRLKGGCA